MIKLTAGLLLFYVLIMSILLYFTMGSAAAISCLAGGMLMLVNLSGLYFIWSRAFAKKSIALAVVAIVIKYLGLGYIFWSLSNSNWLHPTSFILGLTSLLLAILSMTVVKSFVRKTTK